LREDPIHAEPFLESPLLEQDDWDGDFANYSFDEQTFARDASEILLAEFDINDTIGNVLEVPRSFPCEDHNCQKFLDLYFKPKTGGRN